jgi:MSHA biogenesis protein MshP
MMKIFNINNRLQRGVSIITAIFLLVILALLGTMMVTFMTAQQHSSAMDVRGALAYQAARTGIEWAAYNVEQTAPGTLWAGCAAIPAPLMPAGTLGGTLAPFAVTVTCNSQMVTEGAATIYVYTITSTASSGGVAGNADFVQRVVTAMMRW